MDVVGIVDRYALARKGIGLERSITAVVGGAATLSRVFVPEDGGTSKYDCTPPIAVEPVVLYVLSRAMLVMYTGVFWIAKLMMKFLVPSPGTLVSSR